MKYQEHAPARALQSFVHCIWTLEGHASELGDAPVQPILPDGRPELVVHFGDPFERIHHERDGAAPERQPAVLFAGQMSNQLLLRPTSRIAALGVRFLPHGAAALTDCPQNELADLTIDLVDVSRPLTQWIAETRESARSLEDARHAVEARLAAHVTHSRLNPHVEAAVGLIRRHRGSMSIETIAARVGITRRHLERQFKIFVGLSPKRLARITRLQHALSVLECAQGSSPGADTAAMCGYADQAHFIRECQDLCGCAPGADVLQRAQLTAFFRD